MPIVDNPAALSCGCDNQQVHSPYALPSGVEPLIVADFKNAVYQIEGANVAITDIFEENTDFGAYSPSDVQAGVGLVASFPVLKAALAVDPLANGYTVIWEAVFNDSSPNNFYAVDMPNWDQELYGGLNYDNVADKLQAFIQGVHGNEVGPSNLDYPARYKLGASIDGTDIAMSVAGTSVIDITGGPASTLDTIAIYANNIAATPFEMWALYPYQDAASLDELTGA